MAVHRLTAANTIMRQELVLSVGRSRTVYLSECFICFCISMMQLQTIVRTVKCPKREFV
jgi:hypothetical protein